MDPATADLLTGSASVPKECQDVVKALESAPMLDDEEACAGQMREIVAACHLTFDTLISEPGTLLRCSAGMEGSNGALWTRFTVQYNLYAGSIVAMGTDEQRAALVAMQSSGSLGCFAFTERGAGVLSGAAMETTATYDSAADEFVIQSPTASSTKTWISQGMYAEHAVILARLFVDGEDRVSARASRTQSVCLPHSRAHTTPVAAATAALPLLHNNQLLRLTPRICHPVLRRGHTCSGLPSPTTRSPRPAARPPAPSRARPRPRPPPPARPPAARTRTRPAAPPRAPA
jgi:hypothetical protein